VDAHGADGAAGDRHWRDLLVQLPRDAIMFALGCFALLYAGYSSVAPLRPGCDRSAFGLCRRVDRRHHRYEVRRRRPPYAIYLSLRGLSKEQYRATLTMTSMFSISLRLTAFTLTGVMLQEALWLAVLVVLPAAWLGLRVASRVFQRIARERVMRCCFAGTAGYRRVVDMARAVKSRRAANRNACHARVITLQGLPLRAKNRFKV
jgi:hypothetical protein